MSQISAPSRRDNPLFEQLPEYRALLEEQWRQQVANIVELSYDAHSPTADDPDDGSRSDRLQVTARLIAAARQQLEETEGALARVDDGSYGLCGNCDEPIPRERLDILPATRYCVSCRFRRVIRR
jgi:RNA polymerase-binding transcription factor DksA